MSGLGPNNTVFPSALSSSPSAGIPVTPYSPAGGAPYVQEKDVQGAAMFKILLRAFNYRERRDKSDSARCYLDLLYQEGLVAREGQPLNGWGKAVLRKEDPLKE
jgi:hypothetical protein